MHSTALSWRRCRSRTRPAGIAPHVKRLPCLPLCSRIDNTRPIVSRGRIGIGAEVGRPVAASSGYHSPANRAGLSAVYRTVF